MDYLEMLNRSYSEEGEGQGRFEFLADAVFGFTTYENEVSALMAEKCLEVCRAVTDRKTFEYIRDADNNQWYLIMVNMPFLKDRLEWGTSIRGAWWDLYGDDKFTIKSCLLFQDDDQLLEISFNEKEWTEFVNAMSEFVAVD